MGRRKGGKGCGNNKDTKARTNNARWGEVPETNENFEEYYKRQKIVPEDEWTAFMKQLKEPLPTTFRITSSREIAQPLNEMIEKVFVPFLSNIDYEGTQLEAPKQLEWYPGKLAWQINVPKQVIRKTEPFKKFQHFLVSETEAGNISRQEAVSMIPPLLLDVKPEHYVLDLCAAPGSKSAQLLEAIHAPSGSDNLTTHILPSGLLIANDADAKRCHLLVHQSLHRIPASEMMVTNHDASRFPGLRLPGTHFGRETKWAHVLFDRILADVPCSGDGTLRKNIGIWKDWYAGNGVGLHSLQLRILLRGIQLLKPGGRIVYSTCSMNPVENEAVLSAALDLCPDMYLVDVTNELPGLPRREGLTTWEVLDSNLENPVKPEVGATTEYKEGQKKTWTRTLWPNGKEEERGLRKACRFYPHLSNTGAFFVAVLEKKPRAPKGEPTKRALSPTATSESEAKRAKVDESEEKEAVDLENLETTESKTPEEKEEKDEDVDLTKLPADIVGAPSSKITQFKEEPYIYLPETDPEVQLCIDFFDLKPEFPMSSLLVRNAEGKPLRSIYFTSPLVHTLLDSNSYSRMRLISCGTKLFARQGQDSGKDASSYRCKWRLLNEGLEVIRPFMGPKRIVSCQHDTLKKLMGALNVPLAQLEDDVEFCKKIEEMEMGSCVLEVEATGKDIAAVQKLVLPFWRSKTSVNLMIEKLEKSALSNRLYGEDITPNASAGSKRDQKPDAQEPGTDDSAAAPAAEELTETTPAIEQ